MKPFYDNSDFVLYNGDCIEAMKSFGNDSIDIVITSPPYGTCRDGVLDDATCEKDKYHMRYDVFVESRTPEEYAKWSIDVFNEFDRILKENRIVLYNYGLGSDSLSGFGNADWFNTVVAICEGTNFNVADLLFWKKKTALPNNMSPNKSTRIVEPVIVFCRKNEIMTFLSNKKQTSEFKTGQKLYSPFYNIFEARNNDGACDLNKATYSTQFVDTLIDLYCPDELRNGWTILDPFSGTGTTGVSAMAHGMKYIGVELSEQQCRYAVERIGNGTELYLF